MNKKRIASRVFSSSLETTSNALGCILVVASLLLCTHHAKAGWHSDGQINVMTNFFDGGDEDPYPGFAGFAGWNTIWNFSNGDTNLHLEVVNTAPLNGSNNYLSFSISNTTSTVAARRQITSYLSPPTGIGLTTNGQTVNVSSQPMRFRFDWRLESFTSYNFTNEQSCITNYVTCTNDLSSCSTSSVYASPPPNFIVTQTNVVCTNTGNRFVSATNNWGNSRNDNVVIHAANNQRTSFNTDTAWTIFAQMGASRIQDPFGPANQWLLYDGSPIRTDAAAGTYVPTGYFFTNGVVYHFDIVTDPRDKTYTVTIADDTGTNAAYHSPTLRWRCFGDVTVLNNRGYFHFGGTLNDTNSVMKYSVDSIAAEFLPPSDFPPFVTNIRPGVRAPFNHLISAAAGGTGVPPLNFVPDYENNQFWPASRGISFVAQTAGGASNDFSGNGDPWRKLGTPRTKILESGIGLMLNGTDVSGSLAFSRPFGGTGSNYVKVTYNGLVANTNYNMLISVTNSAGAVKQRKLNFDTLDESFVKVIEAEDYNYSDATFTRPTGTGTAPTVGGFYQDNPTPSDFTNGAYLNSSGYVDKMGYITNAGGASIDYFVPNSTLFGISVTPTNGSAVGNVYRFFDAVGTAVALDLRRKKYDNSGARDFVVTNIFAGEWLNYTRTFAGGTYNFYLHAANSRTGGSGAATGINAVSLDYVTSDPTQPGQTTTNIGVFLVAYTGGVVNFTNAPLIATNTGAILSVTLPAGVHTLRLTATNASNDLLINYIVATPLAASAPSVTITTPADGASFTIGANIALTASASVGTSLVEYFNGTTSIGSSSAGPTFPVTWSTVPQGRYSITAKATTGAGFSARSAPITIKVGSPPAKVLFVIGGKFGDVGAVDAGNTGTGDQFLRNLFAAKGWARTDLYATNVPFIGGLAASSGFDLVAASASVQSGDIAYFRDVNVPLWTAEQGAAGTLCFCHENTISTEYGVNTVGTFRLRPDVAGLPGTAGLPTGLYNMSSIASGANFMGSLNENVIPILSNTNAPAAGGLANPWSASTYCFYYPAGAELWNGIIAGGCRYMWYSGTIDAHVNTPLTATGTNLLNAGLDLALSNPVFTGVTIYENPPVILGNNVTIAFRAASYETAADYSLWSSATLDGVYSKDLGAVITKLDDRDSQFTASTTTSGPTRFYRVRRN